MRQIMLLLAAALTGCNLNMPDEADTAAPLTSIRGDQQLGRAVFASRDQGHCVLCHEIDSLDVPFQGDLGPPLNGIGSRLSAAQIRYRIIDASELNPATIMPPYFRAERLTQVAAVHQGETLLSAEQIEHLVAYLSALRQLP